MSKKVIAFPIAVLTLAGALSAAAPPAGEPVVIASSHVLTSKILGEERRINIYLPPGHEAEGAEFPVLYLLDGGVQEDLIHIVGIASLAADFRHIRSFIVVGVEGVDRYHDFSPPTRVATEKQRVPNHGGSAEFRAFLARELKPFVENHFPVTDESVLIGESMAGLFVVESFLRDSSLFGAFVAVSPSLWWDESSLVGEAGTLLRAESFARGRRLFLTIGDEGGAMQESVDTLVEALENHAPASLDWSYEPMHHESHGTIFHPAALAAVRTLFSTETLSSEP